MRPSLVTLSLMLLTFQSEGAETATKPLVLLNGEDLAGWEYVTPAKINLDAVCHIKPDGILLVEGKPNGYLATTSSYENYRLHVEWRWTEKAGNGGVLLHISEGPMDRIWPISLQVQTKHRRVGDLLPMSTATFGEPLSNAPDVKPAVLNRQGADSEKPVGEWNSCDIECRGDTIEVTINGVFQNRVTKCVPASGKIGIQLEGAPFELRNIRIEPLMPVIDASPQSAPHAR
jgi:hypothetical protein